MNCADAVQPARMGKEAPAILGDVPQSSRRKGFWPRACVLFAPQAFGHGPRQITLACGRTEGRRSNLLYPNFSGVFSSRPLDRRRGEALKKGGELVEEPPLGPKGKRLDWHPCVKNKVVRHGKTPTGGTHRRTSGTAAEPERFSSEGTEPFDDRGYDHLRPAG